MNAATEATIEALKGLRPIGPLNATALQDEAEAALRGTGMAVLREVIVNDRGDGYRGRIDLVARHEDGSCCAVELDNRSVRAKSMRKLRGFHGGRVIGLRAPWPPKARIPGIDAVIGLSDV